VNRPDSNNDQAPLRLARRNLAPVLSGLGSTALLAIGGHTLTVLNGSSMRMAAARSSGRVALVQPPAPEALPPLAGTPVGLEESQPEAPSGELMGPPAPGRAPGRLAGRIGPMGPIDGPLNTSLTGGPVRGPIWSGAPLPRVGEGAMGTEPLIAARPPGPQPVPAMPAGNSDISSEIPDAQKIMLSRLANPQPQTVQAVEPRKKAEASAEKPLALQLSIGRPRNGYQVGSTVTVRMSTSIDAFVALVRVDASGKSSTVFHSPGPSRHFTCALRAGPEAGRESLVAVASVHPLSGAEAQAIAASGSAGHWQRYEWAVSSASFATREPDKPRQPAQVDTVKRGPEKVKPAGTDSSTLPQPEGSQVPTTGSPAKPEGESGGKTPSPKDEGNAPKSGSGATDGGQ
jgi:hypothetical protein